ncbi:MAG: YraN family protein [Desulfopila sp.]
MSHNRRILGQGGESTAVDFLRRQGYTILETNFTTKNGEIDIVAAIDDILVFTEVKTRKSTFLGSPLAAVTSKKQRQISKVALGYLKLHKLFDNDARFDVIAVQLQPSGPPRIEHIENAFDLNYG